MTANEKNDYLRLRLSNHSISVSADEAATLRRAASALQRWHEVDCSESDPAVRRRSEARAAGAAARVRSICTSAGTGYYIQSDPRGCPLYIGKNLTPTDHSYVGCAILP